MSTDQDRWQRIKKRLCFELGEDVFSSWFGRVEFESVDRGMVRLSMPTRFLRKWIQSHYADRVLAHWQVEDPTISRLELSVRSAAIRPASKPKPVEPPAPSKLREMTAQSGEPRTNLSFVSMNDVLGGSPLDPRLTFETFIVGRSNTLAHAAAKQIATSGRGDQIMFNPLYIHAAVGLGKTHLLQAITWAGNNGDRKVLYLTAEQFMSGFVSALKSQTALAFKEALRANDILVIDDLQFLQGRSMQHEFCRTTINTLIDAGRQVVIASDRPPADLENLDDRLRSRLAGGLVVEIGSLGEELRLEILKSRIAAARLHHPRFEVPTPVLVFIAKSVTHNGRDLEGAVNRLLAHDIERPAGDAGNGRARNARPDPAGRAQARAHRGHPARRRAAIQRQPRRSFMLPAYRQRRSPPPSGDVPGKNPDAALAPRDWTPLRWPRPHHGAACRAQDRRADRQ